MQVFDTKLNDVKIIEPDVLKMSMFFLGRVILKKSIKN